MLITPTIDPGAFDHLAAQCDPLKLELIRLTLDSAVSLKIADFQSIGGPQDYHLADIQRRAGALFRGMPTGSGGADLLFGGKLAGAEMAMLIEMLAFMAFQPGGVTAFGLHFEAEAAARPGPDGLGGVVSFTASWLAAEMWSKNEEAEILQRAAIADLIQTLYQRSQAVVCFSWRSPVMPVDAYWYFHEHCIEQAPPRMSSGTIGRVRRVFERIAPGTMCGNCGLPLWEES